MVDMDKDVHYTIHELKHYTGVTQMIDNNIDEDLDLDENANVNIAANDFFDDDDVYEDDNVLADAGFTFDFPEQENFY